jgi:NTE family protein
MQSERVWHHLPAWTGLPDLMSYWTTLFGGISGFVRPNAAAFMGPHLPLGAESAGFYSTTPLRISVGERDQQRV